MSVVNKTVSDKTVSDKINKHNNIVVTVSEQATNVTKAISTWLFKTHKQKAECLATANLKSESK